MEIVKYDVVTSTNDIAKQRYDELPHLSVVTALRQTAGRGSHNRSWSSGDGGLYMSVIVKPFFFAGMKQADITLASARAVRSALVRLTNLPVEIRPPNDLYLEHKKLCGILTETTVEGGEYKRIVVGIGVNVNNRCFDDELNETATSLYLHLGSELDFNTIIREIVNNLSCV